MASLLGTPVVFSHLYFSITLRRSIIFITHISPVPPVLQSLWNVDSLGQGTPVVICFVRSSLFGPVLLLLPTHNPNTLTKTEVSWDNGLSNHFFAGWSTWYPLGCSREQSGVLYCCSPASTSLVFLSRLPFPMTYVSASEVSLLKVSVTDAPNSRGDGSPMPSLPNCLGSRAVLLPFPGSP